MKITIFAAGSQGDIQPCVALGKGLQQAGYHVRLAAPDNFADFSAAHGLDFYPVGGDVQQIMAGDTGREFMSEGSANPLKSIRAIRTMIAPLAMKMALDALDACRGSDGLICLGVFGAFGQAIAEALQIPVINTEPTPLIPTRAFAAPSWPIQRSLGGLHNAFSGWAMFQVLWQWYRPFVKAFRQQLGLPAVSSADYLHSVKTTPMLCAYSPHIIPHPDDWPQSVHVCGYFFLENQSEWQPSAELQYFLDAGEPPVYVGFGSMAGQEPQQLANLVLEALAKSGRRGLLLTGWGGLKTDSLPENIFVLDSAPHSWLFPRMAAVVHHGGAGTTAEGLRAGVPNVILPFIFDQAFWGMRIKALGLGPSPVPQKKLTADRLTAAIQTALTDQALRARAAATGAAIRTEDGVAVAVEIVRQSFGPPD